MTLPAAARPVSALAPLLLGVVLGAGLQLQQPRLWPLACYALGAIFAGLSLPLAFSLLRGGARTAVLLLLAATLSAGAAGWRAASFLGTRLAPALEGLDLQLTGIVASMPHRNEAGLRFRFEPESARLRGRAIVLPPQIMLGWYGGPDGGGEGTAPLERLPGDVRPGER